MGLMQCTKCPVGPKSMGVLIDGRYCISERWAIPVRWCDCSMPFIYFCFVFFFLILFINEIVKILFLLLIFSILFNFFFFFLLNSLNFNPSDFLKYCSIHTYEYLQNIIIFYFFLTNIFINFAIYNHFPFSFFFFNKFWIYNFFLSGY